VSRSLLRLATAAWSRQYRQAVTVSLPLLLLDVDGILNAP
jgi:hypothetical protein